VQKYSSQLFNGKLTLLTTVRDPLTRIVIGFCDKCILHGTAYTKCERFLPKTANRTRAAFSFNDFMSNFYAQKLIAGLKWTKVNRHFRSQSHLCDLPNVKNVIFISQENMSQDLNKVFEKFDLPEIRERGLASVHRRGSTMLAYKLHDFSTVQKT